MLKGALKHVIRWLSCQIPKVGNHYSEVVPIRAVAERTVKSSATVSLLDI